MPSLNTGDGISICPGICKCVLLMLSFRAGCSERNLFLYSFSIYFEFINFKIMKHLKIIILIISAAVFVAVSGCKKHDAVQNTIHNISGNFLDSVIGNYSCIEHYSWSDILSQNGQNTPVFGDSTIGPVLLSVQASSDSAVIILSLIHI